MLLFFFLLPRVKLNSLTRWAVDSLCLNDESADYMLFLNSHHWCPQLAFVMLEFYIINNQAAVSVHWHKCWFAALIKKIFKRGLTVKKLSHVVQRISKVEEERIDVGAASPWVELAQGLIRDQRRTPPQLPSLHTAIGFSLTIQGLIDEPLFVFQPCTFLNLKSQFILSKHKRRRE